MTWIVRSIVTLAALACCTGLGYGVYQYSLAQSETESSEKKREPLAVEVTEIQSRQIADRVELVGSLEAVAQVNIRARTSGYITKMPFDVGEFVEADTIVVEIDKARALETMSRAEAALKVANAQLKASKTGEAEQQANLDRYQKLFKSKTVTAQQVVDAEYALEVAQADVELNQALVEQAESALLTAKLTLKESEIRTSLAGYVAERLAEAGDLADPTTPLLRIVDLHKVRTIVHVTEKDYDKIRMAQSATIEVDAYPGQTFEGEVVRVAPVVNVETRTAAVQIEIDNAAAYLKPGMYARVSLVFEQKEQAPVLPVATILEERRQPYVYVVDPADHTVTERPVETGIFDGDFVEILSGVRPGEQVVALGSRLIADGDAVQVMVPPAEQAAAPAPELAQRSEPDATSPAAD